MDAETRESIERSERHRAEAKRLLEENKVLMPILDARFAAALEVLLSSGGRRRPAGPMLRRRRADRAA